MSYKFANAWISNLSAAAAAGDTVLYVPTGDATNLLNWSGMVAGDDVPLTIPTYDGNGNEVAWEIVYITAINGTTGALTVARAQEGTTAAAYVIGQKIACRVTAGALNMLGLALPTDGSKAMTGVLKLAGYTETPLANATSGAAANIDMSKGLNDITLTANCALAVINSAADGEIRGTTIRFFQDATGSRTVTWPTGTTASGGTKPALSTAAGARDDLVFVDWGNSTYSVYQSGAGMA
ncbi:MAG: hypothetical protein WC426_14090 [Sulfuriferula sp.]